MLLSSDDFASWRWHVTPRDKGRRRLQLIISARTVSADGLAAETALPDQVITVRVRTNYGRSAKRWMGWVFAAVAGGLLASSARGPSTSHPADHRLGSATPHPELIRVHPKHRSAMTASDLSVHRSIASP